MAVPASAIKLLVSQTKIDPFQLITKTDEDDTIQEVHETALQIIGGRGRGQGKGKGQGRSQGT